MNGAYTHVQQALTGVLHMLMGRTDFHARFDVSSKGVAASFGAAILAIPFTVFAALVNNTLARWTEGQLQGGVEPWSAAYLLARWAASWTYFPILAAVITMILDRRDRFGPWLVLHNWTHLFVAMLQLVPFALIVSGVIGVGYTLYMATILVWVYAYIVAAKAGLDIDWRTALGCGFASLASTLLIERGLDAAFRPAA